MSHAQLSRQSQPAGRPPGELRLVLDGVTQKNFKHSGTTVLANLIRFFNPIFICVFFVMWLAEAFKATFAERSLSKGLGFAAKEFVELFNPMPSDRALPLIIEPASQQNANPEFLAQLVLKNRKEIINLMDTYGGVLFRGFNLENTEDVSPAFKNLNLRSSQYWSNKGSDFRPKLDEYFHRDSRVNGRSIQRSLLVRVLGKIVNGVGISWAAPWLGPRHFGYHSEAAYSNCPAGTEAPFASHIAFFSVTPAAAGGYTVISDCRRIVRRIRKGILKREKYVGLWWTRALKPTPDNNKPWSKSFVYLPHDGINPKDLENSLCPMVVKHPRTHEESFANHLVHDGLFLSHRYLADGTQLSELDYFHIWKAHVAETTYFKWQKGDLIILDNWLTAHSGTEFNSLFGSPRELRVATLQLDEES